MSGVETFGTKSNSMLWSTTPTKTAWEIGMGNNQNNTKSVVVVLHKVIYALGFVITTNLYALADIGVL